MHPKVVGGKCFTVQYQGVKNDGVLSNKKGGARVRPCCHISPFKSLIGDRGSSHTAMAELKHAIEFKSVGQLWLWWVSLIFRSNGRLTSRHSFTFIEGKGSFKMFSKSISSNKIGAEMIEFIFCSCSKENILGNLWANNSRSCGRNTDACVREKLKEK